MSEYTKITRFTEEQLSKLDLISKNKRLAKVQGTGVQFLPGYPDRFLQKVRSFINNIDKDINIVEIGGGGLIYFLSLINEINIARYLVVEPDITSTDYCQIINHYNLGETTKRYVEQKGIILNTSAESFFCDFTLNFTVDVLLCFRVVHFFSPEQFSKFMAQCHRLLNNGGHLIITAIGKTDYSNRFGSSINELYQNSEPIAGQIYYRRFSNNETGRTIMEDQNLKPNMLYFEQDYVKSIFSRTGFEILEGPLEATRIVDGYILTRI